MGIDLEEYEKTGEARIISYEDKDDGGGGLTTCCGNSKTPSSIKIENSVDKVTSDDKCCNSGEPSPVVLKSTEEKNVNILKKTSVEIKTEPTDRADAYGKLSWGLQETKGILVSEN